MARERSQRVMAAYADRLSVAPVAELALEDVVGLVQSGLAH
jgi:hypothetical protein